MKMIDAHIHLDHYQDEEIELMLANSANIDYLLSVSFDLESCKRNLQLSKTYQKIKPAFGYHPEQPLPTTEYLGKLLDWMDEHQNEMVAIGEVGLPYYLRSEQKVSFEQNSQYIGLLETFIQLAKVWEKPIVLHAVYDDAPVVCDLLEKYSVKKAHFHWFKGDKKTITRMIAHGYYISITPDVLYEEEIQQLVHIYPLEQMMVETDGPWPFKGPFLGKMTHPNMMMESICMIAKIKNIPKEKVFKIILQNTKGFYQIVE
jgi:TatD DNase family protein